MLEEGEPIKGQCCGHVEPKHITKDSPITATEVMLRNNPDWRNSGSVCIGVYWERTDNGAADVAVGCKCKKFEP